MLGLADLEDEAVAEPLVGQFDLLAVHEFLAEEAVFVTDGVAVAGIAEGGDGVEEAGREASEAAVAETGIGLHVLELADVDAEFLEAFLGDLVDAEVLHVGGQEAAHQEFHREIDELAAVLGKDLLAGDAPLATGVVAHHLAEDVEPLGDVAVGDRAAVFLDEATLKIQLKVFFVVKHVCSLGWGVILCAS